MFLEEIVRKTPIENEDIIYKAIQKRFALDTMNSLPSNGQFKDMAVLFRSLSEEKKKILSNILNPYPNAWYNKEYEELPTKQHVEKKAELIKGEIE
ncbi:hypothetical protein KA405_03865 [Patescibacteria group bacterium]|nr:hypothetical protein [Patescibacteria group bacterium]